MNFECSLNPKLDLVFVQVCQHSKSCSNWINERTSCTRSHSRQPYDAVRKYKPSAYVILSNQLGNAVPKELLSFAGNFNHRVTDMHYYNLHSDEFSNMNVHQNVDNIKNQRASALKTVITSNGHLSFVNQSYAAVVATAVV